MNLYMGNSTKKEKFVNKKSKNMFESIINGIDENVHAMNNSKIFAGLMIITLNISSRFVTIKLSKSMESYLKYTFSKQILVFAIAWMGTRDIYIASCIVILFTLCMDYLLNEDSAFCILPESFTNYHCDLIDNDEDEVIKAKEIIKKSEEKNKDIELLQTKDKPSNK